MLVTAVKAETPAFNHGLRPGDLIVGVNQRRVTSLQELGKALRATGTKVLNVLRGDTLLSIPVG